MLLTDPQAADLKRWVMKKLEDISDADPDILADYAIALIRADAPEHSLKENTLDQLKDFLGPIAETFVTELFVELNKRTFAEDPDHAAIVPSPPAVLASTNGSQNVSSIPGHIHPSRTGHISLSTDPAGSNQAKKRTWQDSHDPSEVPTGPRRQAKQIRRAGVRGTTHAMVDGGGFNGLHPLSYPNAGVPGAPTGPRGDQTQAPALEMMMANFMAFMSMQNGEIPPCPDYFGQGRCARGQACLFNHGTNQKMTSGEEYDPHNPSPVSTVPSTFKGYSQQGAPARNGRPKMTHSPFSMIGPNHDKSNMTLVVEQIPEDNFEESQVRKHFEQFGPIEDVNMQPYKRLALVRFADHASAQAAWSSPKVIFNNRFVKLFWYNSNAAHPKANGTKAASAEPAFDSAKFEVDNAEAQRRHEAKIKARTDAMSATRDIEEKKALLAKEQTELKEKLRARGVDLDGKKKHHDTEALKAQLAALEEEARGMGIDPDAMDDEGSVNEYAPRGRGGFRGRGYHRGARWRGNTWSSRGSYRGGASNVPFRGAIQAGGRYNLDLRPRRVKVSLEDDGATWTESRDETLREHLLLNLGEIERIDLVSEDDGTSDKSVLVIFKDRPTAEMLYYGARYIQGLGKLSFEWVQNPPGQSAPANTLNGDAGDDDTVMDNVSSDPVGEAGHGRHTHRGMDDDDNDDYDIAEEDERWVVT